MKTGSCKSVNLEDSIMRFKMDAGPTEAVNRLYRKPAYRPRVDRMTWVRRPGTCSRKKLGMRAFAKT